MKKLLKSKIAVSVLAVALVVTLVLGGTYAWFVVQSGGDGGTATLKASKFDVTVTPDPLNPIFGHLTPGIDGTWTPCIYTGEHDGHNHNPVADTWLIYPGDAIKFKMNIEWTYNREVFVKVDFGAALMDNLTELLNTVSQLAGKDVTNELYKQLGFEPALIDANTAGLVGTGANNSTTVTLPTGTVIEIYPNIMDATPETVFYIYLPYDEVVDNMGDPGMPMEMVFGLKGLTVAESGAQEDTDGVFDKVKSYQNYWMDNAITVNAAPTVIAVQGTKNAIYDVFDDDLNGTNAVSGLKTWVDGLDIHD